MNWKVNIGLSLFPKTMESSFQFIYSKSVDQLSWFYDLSLWMKFQNN